MTIMRLLYIKKKSGSNTWSNILDKQFSIVHELNGKNATSYDVDTSSIVSYLKNIEKLKSILINEKIDVIFTHHVISAYPLVLATKNKSKVLKILALHESEPVLGRTFFLRYFNYLTAKEVIRYSTIWNKTPIRFFDKVFVLNRQQANTLKLDNFEQINFLGVDADVFKPAEKVRGSKKFTIFFPHNPQRPDKGFIFLKGAVDELKFSVELIVGGKISYNEMKDVYADSDVIVLPSIYETYSMALLEAMACNKVVVASRGVGLTQNLLEKYSEYDLSNFGIFVCDPTKESIESVINYIYSNKLYLKAKTRDLLMEEGLDIYSSTVRLFTRIREAYETYR